MADFSLKFRAEELGKDIENISAQVESELNQAVKDVAHATHAFIISKAQSDLNSTRTDYLKGLNFTRLGDNDYLISLQGNWPNQVEDGFPPFNLKDTLLSSNKRVEVGSRAGLPWVQKGKNGAYAHVPFEHQPFSKAPKAQGLNAALKQMEAYNKSGRKQKITKIFKDDLGTPLEGKVAKALTTDKTNPLLEGLVKYQKVYKSKTGKETVSSIYMTYRTISEISEGWQHPGYEGAQFFKEAEKYVEDQLDTIIKTLL